MGTNKLGHQGKKAVGKKTVPTPSKPKTSHRKWLLLGALIVLGLIFLYRGGVSGFANSMAESALNQRRLDSAARWLSLSQWGVGEKGRREYLEGKLARLNSDLKGMAGHLLNAHSHGFDPKLLDREQAIANMSLGDLTPELEAKAREWISQSPSDIGLLIDALANGLATQSRFEDAASLLDEYEKLFPNDPMVNYRMGIMNEHIRGTSRAEEEYVQALKKDPYHIQSAFRLARIKSGKNAPKDAIAILKTFENGKQALAVKTFMAHCYQQLGDMETSEKLLHEVVVHGHEAALEAYRVLDEVPERFLAASELGNLEVIMGKWDEAKKHLEMALEVNPKDFIARNSYGQVLRRLGLTEQAEKELARLAEERKEYDKITVLRDRINQKSDDTEARIQMGEILFKYESEKVGLFWIRSALTFDPKCQAAHKFLANYYAEKAQTAPAAERQAYQHKAQYHYGSLEKTDSK
jgi:tetratricopeptide (TPR) repeat protein